MCFYDICVHVYRHVRTHVVDREVLGMVVCTTWHTALGRAAPYIILHLAQGYTEADPNEDILVMAY